MNGDSVSFADPSKLRRGRPGAYVDRGTRREQLGRLEPEYAYQADCGVRERGTPQGHENWYGRPQDSAYHHHHHHHQHLARRPFQASAVDENGAGDGHHRSDTPGRLERLDAFMRGRFKICEEFINDPNFRDAVDLHVEEQARRQQCTHLVAYTNRVDGYEGEDLDLAYTATDNAAWGRLHGARVAVTWWTEDGSYQREDSFRFMSFTACMRCQVDQSAGSGGPMKKGWCMVTDAGTKRNYLNKDLFWSTAILWLCTRSAGTYWWDRQFEAIVRNVEATGIKTRIHSWRKQHGLGLMPRHEADAQGHAPMES